MQRQGWSKQGPILGHFSTTELFCYNDTIASVTPKNCATILAARLATGTYKILAWSQDSCFYFHPIECWVGVSLTWGTHSTRVHYGKRTPKIGPTIYCMWILLWHHLHKDCYSPFWKCFHKAIVVLALFEEHRHKSEVLTWTPCFPDLIGGSGGMLAQTRF